MDNYSVFARFYDSVMGERIPEAERIEKMVRQHNPTAKKLLELGCGTGTFLKHFLDRGFQVEGIDLSEEMLAIARKKLPGAVLSQQNMASFSSPQKFDVIVCLFDSINHLIRYADWETTFSRVCLHLNEGGIFIFDINTENALTQLVQAEPIVKEFDSKKMIMTITSKGGIYNWNVKVIEKRDKEEVIGSEDIQERSFPIRQIQDSLRKLFNEVTTIDQNGGEASPISQRVYFVCR